MAEALLEECLQENMDLLRSSTPLIDKTQPRLCRAKSHLNTILSRGRLTVSPTITGSIRSCCSCRFPSLKLIFLYFSQNKGGTETIMAQSALPNQLFPLALQPRYLNEALLLMAKVHYVQGRYRDAQGMCARVGLEELTRDDQPTYHLRLLAEAFVIKGTGNL